MIKPTYIVIVTGLFLLMTIIDAQAGQEVSYSNEGTTFRGYLAMPANASGAVPGILVVHEWWGHNDYARKRADMLADLGYAALAVDMYGDGKQADHPKTAGEFSHQVMTGGDLMKVRFLAAMDFLKDQGGVDSEKTGAIGYCFGGAVVLNMARAGVDLDGVVSFHGSLQRTVETQKPIKTRILVCHGAEDSFIPQEAIDSFKQEMEDAEADYEFISYPGAKHSFTNPEADAKAEKFGIGIAYDKGADQQSWKDMTHFFKETFEE